MLDIARAKERGRQQIIALIFFIYWLLIFEGVLRKWIFPEAEYYLFFLRTPFLLLVYIIAFWHGLWPRPHPVLTISYIFMIASIILMQIQIIIQFAAGTFNMHLPLFMAYGWHNYFFYIPLAFLIAEQFRKEDFDRLIRQTLWFAVLSAPLVIVQFMSSHDAPINIGLGSQEHGFENLGTPLGYVRPFGLFTSDVGQCMFISATTALLISQLMLPSLMRAAKNTLLFASTIALIIMIALSTNRRLYMHVIIIIISVIIALMMTNRRKLFFWFIALGFSALLLFIFWSNIFPAAYDSFITRWDDAWAVEKEFFGPLGFFGRALWGFYAFIYVIPETPFFGYFLGIAANATYKTGWIDIPANWISWNFWGGFDEDFWCKHIIDLGPLLGVMFIFYRIGIFIWLAKVALSAIRCTGNPSAMILFGFAGVTLLFESITGHGTTNGYAWFFLGFCLVAAKIQME